MPSLNKVMLIGHLGADPQVRFITNGTAVANFNVATSERFKSGDEWETRTEWHRVVVWRQGAEYAGKYLKKGDAVYIEGNLQTRKWEDKDGNTKYTTEIVAVPFGVKSLAPRRQDDAGEPPAMPGETKSTDDTQDDLPF